ncbi:cardiolipin synthase [Thermopirellula anaerolimosa]
MDWGGWTFFWMASEWLIRLIMLPVIVLRKTRPSTCLAWLAVVSFLPWPGLVVYLLIGENRLGRRRVKQRRSRFADLRTRRRTLTVPAAGSTGVAVVEDDDGSIGFRSQELSMEAPLIPDDLEPMVSLVERFTGWPVSSGNQVAFLCDAELMVDRLVAEIDAAQDHVHLLFFIFRDDYLGRRVGDALIRAAKRGVVCRVLVDAVGSRRMFRGLGAELHRHGVQLLPALPVRLYRIPFARLDLRNHRKLAVIDGRVAYTGSQNIVEPSYGHKKAGRWHDATARIVGPAVHHLQLLFLEDWFHETGEWLDLPRYFPPPDAGGDSVLQVLPSGPDMPGELFQDIFVKAVFLARERIILTTPYFIPDEPLMMALRLAAYRGVRVDLLIPKQSDHPVVDAAAAFYYSRLARDGVNVHYFLPGLLHAKTTTIDGRLAIFGSANYDIRSFLLNFELNLLLYSPAAVAELVRLQERYLASSQLLREDALPDLHWPRRLWINLAKLLSPLL